MIGGAGFGSIIRVAVLEETLGLGERLLKVGNDVVDVLGSNRDTDQVFGDTASNTLLFVQLLVSG